MALFKCCRLGIEVEEGDTEYKKERFVTQERLDEWLELLKTFTERNLIECVKMPSINLKSSARFRAPCSCKRD
jgi:hypothetical protein